MVTKVDKETEDDLKFDIVCSLFSNGGFTLSYDDIGTFIMEFHNQPLHKTEKIQAARIILNARYVKMFSEQLIKTLKEYEKKHGKLKKLDVTKTEKTE